MAGPVPGLVEAAAGCPAHRGGPGETRTKEHQMTSNARAGSRILGSLRSADGKGAVRVEACEPPRRLLVTTKALDEPDEHVIEAMLATAGDQTILVVEERGMPLDRLAAYGSGIQVHIEDLAAHLAGRERCDAGARWGELLPAYQDLAAKVG